MQQFSAGSGAPSKGQVTPATLKLPSLHLCHHLTGFPPPQHTLGRVQPPPSCPVMASPSTETHGPAQPHSSTCASSPAAEPALRMPEGLLGCPSAMRGPHPSLQSGLAGHQPAGLAEGLLLTADTYGLTVNNKTKSLCTALHTLLHPPGYMAELYDSGRSVLHSIYRVLAGNISFPLTTNTSGKGKKGILPPREI